MAWRSAISLEKDSVSCGGTSETCVLVGGDAESWSGGVESEDADVIFEEGIEGAGGSVYCIICRMSSGYRVRRCTAYNDDKAKSEKSTTPMGRQDVLGTNK